MVADAYRTIRLVVDVVLDGQVQHAGTVLTLPRHVARRLLAELRAVDA